MGFDYCFAVNNKGQSDGLALFWNNDSVLSINSYSIGHIDTTVNWGTRKWRFTGVYGNSDPSKRGEFWELMVRLSHRSSLPWLIGGDFNEISNLSEKEGGRARVQRQMDLFNEMMESCGLRDLGFSGDIFTWRKGSKGSSWIREKLDRFLGNNDMVQMCNRLGVNHLGYHKSNHRIILAQLQFQGDARSNSRRRPLKLEESWLKFPVSRNIIKDCWKAFLGNDSASFHLKIQRCLVKLASWNKNRLQGSIKKALEYKKLEIENIEKETKGFPTEKLLQAEKGLESLLEEEEMYWKIRSREDWLRWGDRNTKRFHAKASQRKKKNEIVGIKDKDGSWVENEEDISKVAVEFFGDLFASSYPNERSIEDVLKGVTKKVS